MFYLNTAIFYIFVIFISTLLIDNSKSIKIIILHKTKKIQIGFILSFFILLVVSGLRYNVGSDFGSYTQLYKYYIRELNSFSAFFNYGYKISEIEPGYILICLLSGLISENAQLHFFMLSFITLFFVYKSIYLYNKRYWGILLFSYLSLFYFPSFNLVRTFVAVAICMYAYRFIIECNFKKFLLYVIIACSFHISAIIMIPLYFLGNNEKRGKILQLFLVFGFPILIIFLVFGVEYLQMYFTNTRYSIYFESLTFSYKPYGLLVRLPILLLSFLAYKDKSNICRRKDFYIRCIVWELLISQLGYFIPAIGKFALYLSSVQILLIPYFIESLSKFIKNYKMSKAIIMLYYLSYLLIICFYLKLKEDNIMPYQLFTVFRG